MPPKLTRAVAAVVLLGVLAAGARAAGEREAASPPVTLAEDAAGFTLANGVVTARIDKRSGDLVSLKYKDLDLLGKASGEPFGYWHSLIGKPARAGYSSAG